MIDYCFKLLVFLSLLQCSCSKEKKEFPIKDSTITTYSEVKKAPSWQELYTSLENSNPDFSSSLSLNTLINLESLTHKSSDHSLVNAIFSQLQNRKKETPIFYNYPITLLHRSYYDGYELLYTLEAPKKGGDAPLCIILSSYEDNSFQVKEENVWKLYIPSRPSLNYQFLSEGDFFNILENVYQWYPDLKERTHYLIGSNESADAALILGNNYPTTFDGIAVSGARFLWDMPNLDLIPLVTFYAPLTRTQSPWNSKHFIQRLRSRGNLSAEESFESIEGALQKLIKGEGKRSHSYHFFDYQFATVTPWLKVVNKTSDFDQATLFVEKEKKELQINTRNIANIQLNIKELKKYGVNSLLFNHSIVDLSSQKELIDVGPSYGNARFRKVDHPGGYLNFFRNEPLVIVYQNSEVPTEFIDKAKNIAKRISKFNFSGLPETSANLPVYSSDHYLSSTLPTHRVIIIGTPHFTSSFVTKEEDLFPIQFKKQQLIVHNHVIKNFDEIPTEKAFALNFPSTSHPNIALAFLLAAETTEGLNLLEQYYCSATTLFDPYDLRVWHKEEGRFKISSEILFNGYWEPSIPPEPLLHIPYTNRETWREVITEVIVEETGIPYMLLSPLLYPNKTPVELTFKDIENFIPNKHLALIILKGNRGVTIANKLIHSIDSPETIGLENRASDHFVFSSKDFKKGTLGLIVEMETLSSLSREELKLINVELLPFSLHEILLDWLTNKPDQIAQLFLLNRQNNDTHLR